jgi:putative ATPase
VPLEYLPEAISGQSFYTAGKNSREDAIADFLKARWKGKYDF